MLPHTGTDTTRLFGTYNTVATLAGSLGALIALVGSSPKWLLAYPATAAAGLLASARLSPVVEAGYELAAEPPHRFIARVASCCACRRCLRSTASAAASFPAAYRRTAAVNSRAAFSWTERRTRTLACPRAVVESVHSSRPRLLRPLLPRSPARAVLLAAAR